MHNQNFTELESWGWTPELTSQFESADAAAGGSPARVVSLTREIYRVRTRDGEDTARPSGTLRSAAELPAIGDWVVVDDQQIIRSVLPRRTQLSRLRRLERLAVMAWESGADPVVVLTKADLADDAMARRFDSAAGKE